jgi:hypothetical protein
MSAWFRDKYWTIAVGGYPYTRLGDGPWNRESIGSNTILSRVRGQEINDVFVVGDFGFIAHFNGMTWRKFPIEDGYVLASLDFQFDHMVAVGWARNGRAIVARFNR